MARPQRPSPFVDDRLPPHNIEAEEAVIGSILIEPSTLEVLSGFLEPDHFFREQNRWCYEACLAAQDAGVALNEVTIAQELDRKGHLQDVGGPGYLARLAAMVPTSLHAEHYGHIVRRTGLMRHLIAATGRISRAAYQAGDDIAEALNVAFTELESVASRHTGQVRRLKPVMVRKHLTNPPLYDLVLNDHTPLTRLDAKTLLNFKILRSVVMERLDFIPAPMKQVDWEGRINGLLARVEEVQAAREASREEQLRLIIAKHVADSPPAQDISDLALGRPALRGGYYHFRSLPLLQALEKRYQIKMEPNTLWALLKEWGARSDKAVRFGDSTARTWAIPREALEEPLTEAEVQTIGLPEEMVGSETAGEERPGLPVELPEDAPDDF